jgi:Ethylbenzene dehydrogenase
MLRWRSLCAGTLFAIVAASTLSCGSSKTTQPTLNSSVVAVGAIETFLNSPQRETRELLIDGRATPIEWNIAGDPATVLMQGDAGVGGDYYVLIRSLWTVDPNNNNQPDGFFLLVQWPDRSADYLEHPLITSADVYDDNANLQIDCSTGDSTLVKESSWSESPLEEDQVYVTIYSDQNGSYPADVWRWGAGTTDPVTPVNGTEFVGAKDDGDTLGQTTHPAAGYMEDSYDQGGGPVRDQGAWTYIDTNHAPGSNVPLFIVSKGTRDSRFNRGKPIPYVIWKTVNAHFGPCDIVNPIRVDDASARDKSWNPGDYIPSVRLAFPTESQLDVLARGAWNAGKWDLEIRRNLVTRGPNIQPGNLPGPIWPDDIQLAPGGHYAMKLTIYDGGTHASSSSGLIPLYLKPRP